MRLVELKMEVPFNLDLPKLHLLEKHPHEQLTLR